MQTIPHVHVHSPLRGPARSRPIRSALSAVAIATLLLATGCGGPPGGVRHAQSLLSDGEYAAADKAADQELVRYPKHPLLWRVKIQSALGRGDNAGAVALYIKYHTLRRRYDTGAIRKMALTTLWQGLRVPSPKIRIRAIKVIERLEVEALARDVGDLVADDDDAVAAAAAIALLRSHPQARRVAHDLLRSSDPRARATVVAGIGRKLKGAARPNILGALDDPSENVRHAAVAALGALKNREDRARLIKIAQSDKVGMIRAAALQALLQGKHKNLQTVAQKALTDSYLGSRLTAVSLLSSSREGTATLSSLLRSPDNFVALRAAAALRKAGQAGDTGVVDRALNAPSWNIRAAALNAVTQIAKKTDAIRIATAALADDRLEVKLAAARALVRLGQSAAATTVFYAALDAARDWPRLQAAIDLVRMDDAKGPEALARLSKSPSPQTRKAAISAHRYMDNASLPLVAALADESADVRIEAAETLLWLLR